MKNRTNDVLYCGVNPDKIFNAKPVLNAEVRKHLVNFVQERYRIRIRKDVNHVPPPWTADPVLEQYRFTNVRREHDRESLWLIRNISNNPNLSYRNKIANSIMFRLFNKKESMEAFGGFVDFDNLHFPTLQEKIDGYIEKNPGYTWFTAAFFVSGMRNAIRKEQLVGVAKGNDDLSLDPRLMIIQKVERMMAGITDWDQKTAISLVESIQQSNCQKDIFKVLTESKGIAGFLGYQIYVDFTYISEFPYSENEFTIAGPGCQAGINLLFEDRDGMNYEEAIFWMRDHFHDIDFFMLFSDLEHHDRCANVMSWENIFCELQKYFKASVGTGRPKKKYRESTDPLPGDNYVRPKPFEEFV